MMLHLTVVKCAKTIVKESVFAEVLKSYPVPPG